MRTSLTSLEILVYILNVHVQNKGNVKDFHLRIYFQATLTVSIPAAGVLPRAFEVFFKWRDDIQPENRDIDA